MPYIFKILIILTPLSCWASALSELEFIKARQQGFAAWQAEEKAFEARREAAADTVKHQREKHAQQLETARDNFRRPVDTNNHLEAAYLEALAREEAKRDQAQKKYAQQHQELQEYIEKYVVPMKNKEYGIEGVNDREP